MNAQDLKNSILQLAIQGKLVEQREVEGTAKELIEKIKVEKEQLIKEGKIRQEKPFPKIEEDEIPYDVPGNWEWVRFGDLGSYKKGPFGSALTKAIFVQKGTETVKVYEQKNAIQKSVDLGDYYITREYFESKMKGFELSPGDIIVSCAGTIGETYVMPDEFEQGIINQALMQMKLMPSVYVEYFLLYFDFILKKTARKSSKGSAIKNIPPFQELKNYVVPLPPLKEQKRIVAKIEELMPYVEKYDKAYSEVEELNKKFPEDMQKSILQYAIQGKLVEQREEEGTAEELFKQIQVEKKKLIEEGKIKKTKALPEITEDVIPFDIPENWKWVNLGDICQVVTGRLDANAQDENGEYAFFTCGVEVFKTLTYAFDCDAVLLGGNNASGDYKMHRYSGKFNAYQRVYVISGATKETLDFIYYVIKFWLPYLKKNSQGTTTRFIKLSQVNGMFIPLPPLEEQKRIVAKIEEMLPYCKQLIK